MMLHEELKELRLRKKISIRSMAEAMSCGTQVVQHIESGRNVGILSIEQYLKILGYKLTVKRNS
jgi:transcriptional regulator with XRE-family HTH domain